MRLITYICTYICIFTYDSKTPSNDELSKNFYKIFWDELKESSMSSLNQKTTTTKRLITSQIQAVIKLVEK